MNRLFERFVGQVLRRWTNRQATVDVQAPVESSVYLGRKQMVPMWPDILVSAEGKIKLVADCKYKSLEPTEFKNHDVYQMLAYCTATGVQQGLLIYPLHTAVVRDEVSIRNTQTVIEQVALDLGKVGIEKLDQECERFAQEVISRVQTTNVA